MWKEYSRGYLKNNRSSGMAVRTAVFISALLLSLLCCLFYNAWKYETERIELEEGGWHSRIVGELDEEEIESVTDFAHVKDVLIREKEESAAGTMAELYFDKMSAVFEGTPKIAAAFGIPVENITYHYSLLAMYLIRGAEDTAPRLVFPLFLLIVTLASFSLIIIIHNAFAITMNARLHQFGILASIGATPKQIRVCLLQEAAALCALPIIVGNLAGIAVSKVLLWMTNIFLGNEVPGRHEALFGYHPFVFLLTLSVTIITIWLSVWIPARKLSRLTPLEAIKNSGGLQLKHRKNPRILRLLFGAEGELAANALQAQKKAMRTGTLSLIFSFMAFTLMQCFFTMSEISTRETYFERYQDTWDIMVTVKGAAAESFEETEEIQKLPSIESAVIYQKAMAGRLITEEEMSDKMRACGGFSHASAQDVTKTTEGWMVNAPIVILDDASFLAYCEQIGISPRLDGVVIRNLIRDVTSPDFRHPVEMPYLKVPDDAESAVSIINILRTSAKEEAVKVPVLAYTAEVPVLREEYATLDYYELVHFMPVSLWKEIAEQTGGWPGGAEGELYIRVLGRDGVTLEELNALQDGIEQIVGRKYQSESENRIQKYETNNRMLQGMKIVFGVFCVLLAIIGIGNIFSNTSGFVRQRKREFARYMSVGMTPGEIRKMFCIEALIVAGRPILFTVPIALVAAGYMLRASYLEVEVFLAEKPFVPVGVFMLVIMATVAFAYYLGWRNVRKIRLSEVLRDDTMM
ncbi:MAG: ABC transporter permease [Ruminococcus sp.]|nr:ABC transporter permease [Ruminococcus sp.]